MIMPPSIVGSNIYNDIQAIIGTDAGDRGMKSLIVEGDLESAGKTLGTLEPPSRVIVLSGFPCCVNESPPTETDGPPGTFAIARAAAALGHDVTVITDDCNLAVFAAALNGLVVPGNCGKISLETFPAVFSVKDEDRFAKFANQCDLLISCERAGPGKDGRCYTMRGIDMNERGLIAPLHRLVEEGNCKTISIGDGGNELGMGKVIENIINNPKIQNGDKIGCVVAADYLIAASVSNWGGYALSAAAALAHVGEISSEDKSESIEKWITRCLPSEEDEIGLLDRCVAAGCRDGVSGKMESTVDGMPLETSLACLRDIRKVTLSAAIGNDVN
jgi:hypothetical protein